MSRKISEMLIKSLKENEIFVIGQNLAGFNGAGSAGYAQRGTAENTWRNDPEFLAALDSPRGSPLRVGKWAVLGETGFQVGREGKSYGIVTIDRPGWLRSIPLYKIEDQLREMFLFAAIMRDYDFLMTPIGCGYSGYSKEEMSDLWDSIVSLAPRNIIVPKEGLYLHKEI